VEKIHRLKLRRKVETVTTAYGAIRVKLGLKGERIVQVAPEFEDCRAAAESSGIPLRLVYDAALHAWQASAPAT
jgi:uncharacterized protein (DUF111 family)